MSQNGQTRFKNLAAFAVGFLKCVLPDHFGTLYIKGLKPHIFRKTFFIAASEFEQS